MQTVPPRFETRNGHLAHTMPAVDVSALVVGKSPEVALDLLPRVFNLCRHAQVVAMNLALGNVLDKDDLAALRAEILREHLRRFCVIYPGALGLRPLPAALSDAATLKARLFGSPAILASTPESFARRLKSDEGIWPILNAIAHLFAPGEACASPLPSVLPGDPFADLRVENSAAREHSGAAVMRHIETRNGRGPLWRVTGQALDLWLCLNGLPVFAASPRPSLGVVRAARGLYAIDLRESGGIVTAFRRITPTDHMLAPGGVLCQSLETLPESKAHLAPLVRDILDPCRLVALERVREDA